MYQVNEKEWSIRDERVWFYTRVYNDPLEDKELDTYAKLTYVMISKFADQKGYCFPSRKTLAELVGCSEPTIDKAINQLIKQGYIKKYLRKDDANKKLNKTNVYIIEDIQKIRGGKGDLPGVVNDINQGGKGDLQELYPINNNQYNNNNVHQIDERLKLTKLDNGQYQYPKEFEEVWTTYPRKTGKKACYRKWKATINKGIDNQLLILASKNYAEECKGRDEKYIKHGSTFFGPDEHWRDYLEEKRKPKILKSTVSDEEYEEWLNGA